MLGAVDTPDPITRLSKALPWLGEQSGCVHRQVSAGSNTLRGVAQLGSAPAATGSTPTAPTPWWRCLEARLP